MLSFLFSFLVAVLITPVVISWYRAHNWLDDPVKQHHVKIVHTQPVPRGGGLVIFAAILIPAFFLLQFDKYLLGILAGALLLTIVGFWDDLKNIHPLIRLFAGLLAGLIVVGSGIGIAYVTNPFYAQGISVFGWESEVIHLNQPQLVFHLFGQVHTVWLLADFFALLFILWNMNIVNWSKGVDGQLPGFVAIGAIFIGLLSQRFLDDPTTFNTAHLSFMVAGAYTGFLVWNFYPQKIMPGYGAGSLAGYFLTVLAILSGAKVATALMILAIPTADAIFTILRRLYAGKSPFWGDRGHLHHKLMDELGWGKRRVAIFYWLTSLALGIMSLYLNTIGKLVTIGLVTTLVFSFLVWVKLKGSKKHL